MRIPDGPVPEKPEERFEVRGGHAGDRGQFLAGRSAQLLERGESLSDAAGLRLAESRKSDQPLEIAFVHRRAGVRLLLKGPYIVRITPSIQSVNMSDLAVVFHAVAYGSTGISKRTRVAPVPNRTSNLVPSRRTSSGARPSSMRRRRTASSNARVRPRFASRLRESRSVEYTRRKRPSSTSRARPNSASSEATLLTDWRVSPTRDAISCNEMPGTSKTLARTAARPVAASAPNIDTSPESMSPAGKRLTPSDWRYRFSVRSHVCQRTVAWDIFSSRLISPIRAHGRRHRYRKT